jgi:hypothetical protein
MFVYFDARLQGNSLGSSAARRVLDNDSQLSTKLSTASVNIGFLPIIFSALYWMNPPPT